MVAKKSFRNILVFLMENGAGGIKKDPTRPDARGKPIRDPLLYCRETGKRFGVLIADLRLFADNAHAGARNVRNDKIEAPAERFIRFGSVHRRSANDGKTESLGVFLYKPELFFVKITGENFSVVFHQRRAEKALSAGRGAGIQHAHPFFRRGAQNTHRCGSILHKELARSKAGERGSAAFILHAHGHGGKLADMRANARRGKTLHK